MAPIEGNCVYLFIHFIVHFISNALPFALFIICDYLYSALLPLARICLFIRMNPEDGFSLQAISSETDLTDQSDCVPKDQLGNI